MTKREYLDIASDLRRSANWLGRDQKEKMPLIKHILDSATREKDVSDILRHFQVDINVDEVFGDDKKRMFLAEQLLISSLRLQRLSI